MVDDNREAERELPDTREFWNEWNATFRAGRGGDWIPGAVARRRRETLLAWVRSLGLAHPEILEVGSGAGWLSDALSEYGAVTALDLADEVVAVAQARFPRVRFLAGDFNSLALPAAYYDLVVCEDVLAYAGDQPGFIARVAERLKPGGFLLLTTPNRFVAERQDDVDARSRAPVHHWHSRRELRALVSPWLHVVRVATAAPDGHLGVLRVVNSRRVDALLGSLCTPERLCRLRESLGFGFSLLLLARKPM